MKKLYFIRHGQSVMNVQGRFAGLTDTPLTEEGRKQAKAAGRVAKKFDIDCIVSSPLSRAHDTAKIIAEEIGFDANKILTSNLLLERNYGSLENTHYSPDLNLDGFADVESDHELYERGKLVIDWLESLPAHHILVVSHGSFGRALRRHFKPDHDIHERIGNAEIVCWVDN